MGDGTVVWDTLGATSKPFASLSHEKRVYTMTMAGKPAPESTSEIWQLCPSHATYGNSTVGIMPGTPPTKVPCAKILAPCLHPYNPVALALAACSVWSKSDSGDSIRYHGDKCNFDVIPVPGVTAVGSFDFDVGASGAHDIKQWVTHSMQTIKTPTTTTIQNSTETVVVVSLTNTPAPP